MNYLAQSGPCECLGQRAPRRSHPGSFTSPARSAEALKLPSRTARHECLGCACSTARAVPQQAGSPLRRRVHSAGAFGACPGLVFRSGHAPRRGGGRRGHVCVEEAHVWKLPRAAAVYTRCTYVAPAPRVPHVQLSQLVDRAAPARQAVGQGSALVTARVLGYSW